VPLLPTDRIPPISLVVGAVVVAAQGLGLAALAVAALLDLVGDRLEVGLSTGVFFLAYAALLLASAWGLLQGAGWARGPALITQLIQLGLAYNVRDEAWLAVLLALLAAVGLAALVHRDSIEALDRERDDDIT